MTARSFCFRTGSGVITALLLGNEGEVSKWGARLGSFFFFRSGSRRLVTVHRGLPESLRRLQLSDPRPLRFRGAIDVVARPIPSTQHVRRPGIESQPRASLQRLD